MKIYPEEWACAKLYQQSQTVPRFSSKQLHQIRGAAKQYANWYRAHPLLHNTINMLVLAALLALDVLVLLGMPAWLLAEHSLSPVNYLLVIAIAAFTHGFIFYSTIVFSIHEGAGHERIIQGAGPVACWLRFLANNACRLFFADPVYYRSRHVHHHADFGTQQDGDFTNFVHPRRFWISLLPLAGLLDFNDFKSHADVKLSLSRVISILAGLAYTVALGYPMYLLLGHPYPLFVLGLLSPWIAFVLDRLRDSTEHNLMAMETENGARNLGYGFWGMIIGGGPWGQPCHLSHHLVPALPWYQQILLHRKLVALMTPEQRRYFTIEPVVGYPKLLFRVLRENHRYLKRLSQQAEEAAHVAVPTSRQ